MNISEKEAVLIVLLVLTLVFITGYMVGAGVAESDCKNLMYNLKRIEAFKGCSMLNIDNITEIKNAPGNQV